MNRHAFLLPRPPLLWLPAIACLLLPSFRALAVDTPADVKVRCGEHGFRYLLFAPRAEGAMPAVLLLHGAGDTPEPMVAAWQSLAEQKSIVLIAPQLPRVAEFEPMAPAVFRCIVEDSKRQAQIDSRRVYVFGNSMGGYLAYDAALLQANYFAAAAIHAMEIEEKYLGIVGQASRKIPIAIYTGDRDQLVSLPGVRRTRDVLKKNGFPVRYVEIQNHDHNYYAVSRRVNEDAWTFFSDKALRESASTMR